jgi:hypothetical protein
LTTFSFWKKGQKSKALALAYRPFLATFFIFLKRGKKWRKVRLYSLNVSSIFSHFFHFLKKGQKMGKSKAI